MRSPLLNLILGIAFIAAGFAVAGVYAPTLGRSDVVLGAHAWPMLACFVVGMALAAVGVALIVRGKTK